MRGKRVSLLFFLLISFRVFCPVFPNQHLNRAVKLERVEIIAPCRPDFAMCSLNLDPSPVNRFAKVVNVNMTLIHRVNAKKLFIEAVMFKLSGNEYKRTAVYYKRNFCEFLEKELKTLLQYDTNPVFKDFQPTCPILEPKAYLIQNYTVDSTGISSFLKMVPLWSIKLQITIMGCPYSKIYNNSTWSEAGEIICYRFAVISSIHEH